MAGTPHRDLEATPARELNQLHDVLNRAGFEDGDRQTPLDVSKVVRSRLARRIIEEERSTEVR